MHEPKTIDSKRYVPGKGGGAAAQQMPIRAVVDTIILPPEGVARFFLADGNPNVTGLAIPENHALVVVSNGTMLLSLANRGDRPINLPLVAGYRRIIPIAPILNVTVNAVLGVAYTMWIEDLRAMEPWICGGEYRP